MKQLIEIPAVYLKSGDLIFDYRHRDLQRVEYVSIEDENGTNLKTGIAGDAHIVHIDYGVDAASADNFTPDCKVTILIDTEKIKEIDPKDIGYR